MMTLTRAGIGMAIAGGIALAVHGMLLAKPARQRSDRALYGMLLARDAQLRSDCAAWGAAEETIEATTYGDFCQRTMWNWNDHEGYVRNALAQPEMRWLLLARSELVCRREFLSSVLPALRDPSFVGLVGAEDVTVEGRNMPLPEHGTIVREDLFTRAGRASWLLKEVTGHPAPIVGVQTDPRLLEDISKDWLFWLASMDGGNVCNRSDLVTPGARPHEPALRRALLDRLAEPFDPPCTELDLPRAYRSRKAHPVRWLGPSLPPGTVVYREVGLTEVAVYLSYKLDSRSGIGDAGYRVMVRDGHGWTDHGSLGFAMFRPYVVVPNDALPILDGDVLQLAVDVRELDDASITSPPGAMRTRRTAHNKMIRCPLPAIFGDWDGDGLTNVEEARLGTDPTHVDTDGDGLRDAHDPAPLGAVAPTTAEETVRLSALQQLVDKQVSGQLLVMVGPEPRLELKDVSFRLLQLRTDEFQAYEKRWGRHVTFSLKVKMKGSDDADVDIDYGWRRDQFSAKRDSRLNRWTFKPTGGSISKAPAPPASTVGPDHLAASPSVARSRTPRPIAGHE